MQSPVRLAGPADEDAVFRLLQLLDKDNGLGFPYHEDAVRDAIRVGTEQKGGFVAVIDAPDKPGEMAASVCLHWAQPWYSRDWFLHEVWLFVDPAYRKGTGYADALMDWVSWLKENFNARVDKPVPFFTSVSSRRRLEAKERWWRRRGEKIGVIFLLR